MAMELSRLSDYVGNIANIAVGRRHAYKAGNYHLLAAELDNRLGESLYMLQFGLSPPPLPWSEGLYIKSVYIMQSSQHRYTCSTVSMLSGSSVYVVSAVPRRSVIPSGLSSLGRQSIPSDLSSFGRSLRLSRSSYGIFSPQQSRPTIDTRSRLCTPPPFSRLLCTEPASSYPPRSIRRAHFQHKNLAGTPD